MRIAIVLFLLLGLSFFVALFPQNPLDVESSSRGRFPLPTPFLLLMEVGSTPISGALLLGGGALLGAMGRKEEGLLWALLFLLTFLLVFSIKEVVERPRPPSADSSGFSFPSGHSAFSMALALAARRTLLPRDPRSSLFFLVPLFVGISRILTGNHYLTDVLGGFLVALFSFELASQASARLLRSPLRVVPPHDS